MHINSKIYLLILFLFSYIHHINAQQSKEERKNISVCINDNEMKLYNLVMQYRQQNGLPTIPISASLTYIAQLHCKDLVLNKPTSGTCNLHSWSSNGNWSSCCYTPDHKSATCMWNKPRELTNYKGDGYEIAFNIWHSDNANYTVKPEEALDGWKGSSGHNSVILNKSIWSSVAWNAIGIGIYKGYATIWFGISKDVEELPQTCK